MLTTGVSNDMCREHFFLQVKYLFLPLLIIFLLLTGCSTISLRNQVIEQHYKIGEQNQKLIEQIELGMSRLEVIALMGSGEIPVSGGWLLWYETSIEQPFRVRYIQKDDNKFMIYYYWTKTETSENFLTPIIFANNKVVAAGWENEKIPEEILRRESWGAGQK